MAWLLLLACSNAEVLAEITGEGHHAAGSVAPLPDVTSPLEHLVNGRVLPFSDVVLDWNSLEKFYAARAYRPVWHDRGQVTHDVFRLLHLFEESRHEGLFPNEYHLQLIAAHLQSESINLDELELLLTDALLKYVRHINIGRLDPEIFDPAWHIQTEKMDFVDQLQTAVSSNQPLQALLTGNSRPAAYTRLKQLLLSYRSQAEAGGWPVIPAGARLEQGIREQRVRLLRYRLMLSSDLANFDYDNEYFFDARLALAVRHYQDRHGLKVDGVVGRETLASLNVSVVTRIQKIQINMERWRWLPASLGQRYLMVNMAGFELTVVEDDRSVMNMRVIIGRPYRSTPAFRGDLRYLVFNPYWNVPYKLAVRDILPKQQADSDFLASKGFRVYADWSENAAEISPDTIDWTQLTANNFPYRLRQDPGEANSLGRIKFMLPNTYAVYLHDTPSRHLFERPVRMFSSGCIRVQEPTKLASYLLKGKMPWTEQDVLDVIEVGKNRAVNLPSSLPVYLVYLTAWVDDQGAAHFRDDIYHRDLALQRAWVRGTS